MRKQLYNFCALIFCILMLNAQDVGKIFPTGPNSDNLMKFEEVPVSYYTGIPDISIPIYNTVIKDIPLDIQLKYHPLNAKPEDRAGDVGLGWSLIAGGSITRTVMDLPDEMITLKTGGGKSSEGFGIYYNSDYENSYYDYNFTEEYINHIKSGTISGAVDLSNKYLYGRNFTGRYDGEYDLYQYNFFGNTGRFYLKKNGSNYYVEKLDNNNIIIRPNITDKYDINGFEITDDQGNVYFFNVKETLTTNSRSAGVLRFDSDYSNISSKDQFRTPAKSFYNGGYHSTYLLSEVKNSSAESIYTFAYSDPIQVAFEDTTIKRWDAKYYQPEALYTGIRQAEPYLPKRHEGVTTTTYLQERKLTDVFFSAGQIHFEYEAGRNDTNYIEVFKSNLRKLKSVSIMSLSGNTLQSYELNYSDLNFNLMNNGLVTNNNLRLLLTDVIKKDKNNDQIYSYNLGYNNNFSNHEYGVDYWGYFNCNNPHDEDVRRVNPACINTGMLNSMTLPTKGRIEFAFGSNTYNHDPATDVDFDDNVDNWNEESTQFEVYNPPVRSKIHFLTLQDKQTIHLETSLFNPYHSNTNSGDWMVSVYRKRGENDYVVVGGFMAYQSVTETLTINEIIRDLPAGEYYYSFEHLIYGNTHSILHFSTIVYYKVKNNNHYEFANGGGVRIDSIRNYDKNVLTKQVNYLYKEDLNNPKTTSGALVFPKPKFSYERDFSASFYVTIGLAHPKRGYSNSFTVSSTKNFLPVQKTQGSDVGYHTVQVKEEGKGRTKYTFTSPIDKPIDPDEIGLIVNPPFFSVLNNDYERGILKQKQIYDNVNLLSESEYSYLYRNKESEAGVACIPGPYSSFLYFNDFTNYDGYVTMTFPINATTPYAGLAPHENIHDYNLNYIKKEFFGKSLVEKTITKNYFENGTKIITDTMTNFYNNRDYVIKNVKSLNNSNEIIESSYQYAHEKGNQKLIDANMIGFPLVTETKKNGNLLSRVETLYPDQNNHPTSQAGGLLVPLSVIFQDLMGIISIDLTYDHYDNKGNLLQYTTRSGVPTAIVWGYNNTKPIAKVEGANYSQISGLASAIISASDTDASQSPNNDEGNLLTALKTFRESFPNYQITTYTYDPLIGVRSITPPNGIRQVYIYDTSNRLKEVREHNATGNLLKEYQYNYKP